MTRRSLAVHAVVLLVLAAGIAALAIFLVERGDDPTPPAADQSAARLDDPQLVSDYVGATTADIQAVTSYDYRNLDGALSNGLQVTTGAYQRSYRAALTGGNAVSAVRDHVVQTFDLQKIGVGAMTDHGRQAEVLVFGIERATSTAGARAVPVTLAATVRKVGDRYLISALAEDANAGLPPGTAGLRAAAEAGRVEVGNLLTFRRAGFAADRGRAIDGAAATLRPEIARRADATRAELDSGHFDLTGAATAVAVESATGDHVTMLVAATGQRIGGDGRRTVVTDGRFEVGVARVGATWLVDQVTAIGTT